MNWKPWHCRDPPNLWLLTVFDDQIDSHFICELSFMIIARDAILLVWIDYSDSDASVSLVLGEQWQGSPSDELVLGLRQWLGKEAARVGYA